MQIKLNGGSEDLSAMLIGAERYALGRKTYINRKGQASNDKRYRKSNKLWR